MEYLYLIYFLMLSSICVYGVMGNKKELEKRKILEKKLEQELVKFIVQERKSIITDRKPNTRLAP